MYCIEERNVHGAYQHLANLMKMERYWEKVTSRGTRTWEIGEPVATTYYNPTERVLFDPERDANPFFHLMEAVWIAAGRRDAGFLKLFLPSIADYSDDGKVFNAAYGYRLREHFGLDQLRAVVTLLRRERTTRRAFWVIGDPHDLERNTKDVACNVAVFFKLRDGQLHLTVSNRSNDAVWGAYGANVVQFSFLQELVAAGVGAEVGYYTQVSNSFHVYPDNPKVQALMTRSAPVEDPYLTGRVYPHPIVHPSSTLELWLEEAEDWVKLFPNAPVFDPFFRDVLNPMASAFLAHRVGRNTARALTILESSPAYTTRVDWIMAGHAWLTRRLKGAA